MGYNTRSVIMILKIDAKVSMLEVLMYMCVNQPRISFLGIRNRRPSGRSLGLVPILEGRGGVLRRPGRSVRLGRGQKRFVRLAAGERVGGRRKVIVRVDATHGGARGQH